MKGKDDDIELLEEIDDIVDILEMETLTEKDYGNLESLEQITNLCVFAYPIFGTCYAFANFHSTYNFITATLSLGAGLAANSCSKKAEVEYIPKLKYNRRLRALRKRFAKVLLALNITTMSVSGMSILDKSISGININRTGIYNSCRVLDNFTPSVDTILESLEYSISNNLLLMEEEREQIRSMYPYFQDNQYLDFFKVYRTLNTIDVLYMKGKKVNSPSAAADYNRKTNKIRVYNNNSIEENLQHEIIHATGNLNIRFLNEGLTSMIVSEYYYRNGNIKNDYIPEVYLTSIIIELVGKDTMLEAFSTENTDLIVEKLLENSNINTVQKVLHQFEEVCAKYREITMDDEESKQEFLQSWEDTKVQLIEYLNQKLPCDNPRNMLEQVAVKATIYKHYNRFKIGLVEFIPKFYFNKNKYTSKSNANAMLTLEEAIDVIEQFEGNNSKEIHKKY